MFYPVRNRNKFVYKFVNKMQQIWENKKNIYFIVENHSFIRKTLKLLAFLFSCSWSNSRNLLRSITNTKGKLKSKQETMNLKKWNIWSPKNYKLKNREGIYLNMLTVEILLGWIEINNRKRRNHGRNRKKYI